MQIRVGFEMIYDCPQPSPMIFNLNVHFTRVSDLVGRDDLVFGPPVPMAGYRDSFGNWCTRVVAPKGRMRISADAIVNDTGAPDVIVPEAQQIPVQNLPEETLLSCSEAGIAKPIVYPKRRGSSLDRRLPPSAAA